MIAVLFALLAGLSPQPAGARPPADQVARELQKKYESVRDFSAEFEQVYEGGVLRKTVTERGTVLVKKPGMMRWTYTAPERKEFVSDGHETYLYVPAERQVTVTPVPADAEASTPLLFLAGKGNLTRDFTASYADMPEIPRAAYALKLVPRQAERDYDWLVLVVDRGTLQLEMLVTVDSQGGRSSIAFTNLKENVAIPDKEFVFKIPRGVEVIHAVPSRQK